MITPLAPKTLLVLFGAAALAACATEGQIGSALPSATAGSQPVPGGAVREGGSIASMADQYARPRLGTIAAAGASAWVAAAPPPAFVASGPMPPADPPAPPPAAVANRQPAPAASAVDVIRPEAAGPPPQAPAPAGLSAASLARARQLFLDQSCGVCHALADAGSGGGIGPGLDRNASLTRDHIVTTVKDGRGPMPGFAAVIEDADIGLLADYIIEVARK